MTKTVLITGSSRGIGLALAERFHADGWNVIGSARSPATADKLKALNLYKVVQLDTTDEASVQSAAKELEGEAIDVLINNAGMSHMQQDFDTLTKDALLEHYLVNAVGPFFVSRAFTQQLKAAVAKNGSAKLIQISTALASVALNDGGVGYPAYRASKAALNMLHSSITHQLKGDKIICVAMCPGYVATELTGYAPYTIQPSESASAISKVIEGLSADDKGKFFNNQGEVLPW
ncbi:hypothetical protein Poli38472_007122 [Pythium oligandrum]|uniref:C-factor n=1 Tax=Pythium oligandrum TaxID=41045 RepID=A0A8K1CAP4_PYTOL|nr:hypothetical protein Poli38472_007119 [Pythium oligandrum]TMW58977.1 hypothetical protein Poli38472_007122 [Pythium oligandrum]|eukprot:TMW58974.1 hypothetical protein Poli38472_007119 [Pythium oligandrum]